MKQNGNELIYSWAKSFSSAIAIVVTEASYPSTHISDRELLTCFRWICSTFTERPLPLGRHKHVLRDVLVERADHSLQHSQQKALSRSALADHRQHDLVGRVPRDAVSKNALEISKRLRSVRDLTKKLSRSAQRRSKPSRRPPDGELERPQKLQDNTEKNNSITKRNAGICNSLKHLHQLCNPDGSVGNVIMVIIQKNATCYSNLWRGHEKEHISERWQCA